MIPEHETEASIPPAAFKLKMAAPLRIRACVRRFRWIPGALVYGWIAVSTQAAVNPSASQLHAESLNVVTSTLSVIPGQQAFYPVLSLLAAVASTHILRRRRLAQLAAIAAAER